MTRPHVTGSMSPLAPKHRFYSRFGRAALFSSSIVAVSLAGGTLGYHALQPIGWIDALHKAALILSGMGPVEPYMTGSGGKLFEAAYAIYSGVILLGATALLITPVFHRILHRFHLQDSGD